MAGGRASVVDDPAVVLDREHYPGVNGGACVLGGVSEWLKVAHTAASFDLPVAPHWNADVHVHLAGAVANCLTVEYFLLEEDIYNFERIVADRLKPKDGMIPIP